MKPKKGAIVFKTPITIDVSVFPKEISVRRIRLAGLIEIGIIILCIIAYIKFHEQGFMLYACIGVPIFAFFILRYAFLQESFFKKKFEVLKEKDYVFDSSLYWDIGEVNIMSDVPIFKFSDGRSAVFLAFDKDVKVGKGAYNDYNHRMAIADAYQYLAKKKLDIAHIDYMDVVGKDDRFDRLIDEIRASEENEDLVNVLTSIFGYQKAIMSRTYSSYDVYAIYFKDNEVTFLQDLPHIISLFMNANYIRYKYLDITSIREIVRSVFNLEDFSCSKACDNIFSTSQAMKYIRLIWTESGGKRTKYRNTRAEMAEAKRIREATSVVKRKKGVKKKDVSDLEKIDIFGNNDDEIL